MDYGTALAAEERQAGDVPVMSSGGVTGRHSEPNFGEPAIVVGRKGSHGSVWWTDQAPFVIDTAYGIDSRYTTNDLRWLYYALQALRLPDLSNDVGVPGLSREAAYEAPLPVVGVEEQRRIADFLDDRVARIDQIIAGRRQQVAQIDGLVKSYLAAEMLYGPSPTPLARLIADERAGLWGEEPQGNDLDVLVARVADFKRSEFLLGLVPTVRNAPATHVAPRLLEIGDVLLEKSGGTNLNPVGCPAYVAELDGPTVSSNFVTRLRPASDAHGRYLALVLGALYATRQQEPHSTQTTGIQNLSTSSYFRVLVPKPTLALQAARAAEVDHQLSSFRQSQGQLGDSITLLQEYKQSLITAAVTGELDATTASSRIPE